MNWLLATLLLLLPAMGLRAEETIDSTPVKAIASQADPAKLARLKGEQAANSRLQKCVYWLVYAEEQGQKPEAVLDESAMLENLKIAKELGLLTPEGMAELRRGRFRC